MIDEERASELRETKRELYKKIRELVDRKNIIELQLGDLRNRYQVADRELAEMNVTIIKLSENLKLTVVLKSTVSFILCTL